MEWIEEVNKRKDSWNKIFSFEEYMHQTANNPRTYIRSSAIYFRDLFHYFGGNEKNGFQLFKREYPDSIPICGQVKCQQKIYENLSNFYEEGFNNKFILLIGPNGSSKTSLIRKIMLAAEEYSQTDEGKLHTFSWIFPLESHIKGTLGLQNMDQRSQLSSFAYLDDSEIAAIINSDLKDHPLLLVPRETRQELLKKWLSNDGEVFESVKKSFLYNGEMATKNQMIYNALLKSYKGDHLKVLKHIRVERFSISKSQSMSVASVEPQMHVDAKMQQLTMDKRLASLPPSLQSLNLYQLQGEAILANRGILEFSDLLKRPLDAFKYLLMTVENKSINLQGILLDLDVFLVGTSNEIHFQAFKQHPDFNSFKARMNFIRVPYLLSSCEEEHIYDEQVKNLSNRCIFEPGALEALCLFAVMTRIRPSQKKNFKNESLGEIASGLSPLEKVLFYRKDHLPERFNIEEKQVLKGNKELVLAEYENDNLYEGNFGISPREIKQILYEISLKSKTISFIEIIDCIEKLIERKNEYEFLNITPQGNYHNPTYFCKAVKDYALHRFDLELRSALELVDERSYEDYISKYTIQISALIKGEKIKNELTGKMEESDLFFIKEFESNINLQEDTDKFRKHMISKIGAFSLDNPNQKIIYTHVFPEITKKLKESFHKKQKRKVQNIAKDLVYFIAEKSGDKAINAASLGKEGRDEIVITINNLKKRFHYSEEGAIKLLQYTIQELY
ncbi:MAG: hypothetical protein OXB88_01435 [Bacteriovoracales bacterium]|nr:hypothetical protein [Bacteriovoracales bacterium]